MKVGFKLISATILFATASVTLQAASEQPIQTDLSTTLASEQISKDSKIQQFLQKETPNLSKDFPYRINIFTQGQIDKNKAGLRIAETANQFQNDTSGLLFYYELVNNAMRVPHWHANATEIGTVLNGKMRVTIWEGTGVTKVYTVEKHGTWIIPKAKLHALENVGDEDMKFLVAYDSPIAADRDFLTAWASLPDAVLARAVGLTESDIAGIKKTTVNKLSSYDPSAGPEKVDEFSPLSNNFRRVKPLYQTETGSITRIDSKINPHMYRMALQRTIMKPGALRIPHWYTSGDVLLYVHSGNGFFSLMNNDGKVYHALIKRGDLISIPVGNFNSFLNIGTDDLEIYEAFNRAHDINEITLMNGVQHFSVGMIEGATGLSKETVRTIAKHKEEPYIVPF
ncbi:Oxalate decarboxylase oxdC [Legionella quateirensis]|uniref:Oxalate decarboxylase OxdC n=2 Tax=Legionella quateirensis TaxID=45072 RepID=A0A378KYJ4_9GAMM|nr:Oxalate decarboxylase OxdC [Legionella quateirensis]STY16930.1 Oxalate decarboxylase oxdC [Legionella quateirensis]